MSENKNKENKMWGGRFASGPSEIMEKINASISFDKKLFAQDIRQSKAHAEMLTQTGIISKADGQAIEQGLNQVYNEINGGNFTFKTALEDIHMNIESRLTEIIGEAGGRLHTARSRNDQVATDFKLWVRDEIDFIKNQIKILQQTLINQADKNAATVMPGFTHLQTAQPVTFGHHLMAYVEMFGRDGSRFADCRSRLNESPLGSAALAGTSYPIDRHLTAKLLDFDRPCANSIDGVSDRDFALEFLASASICAVHLSRLAEELIIWMSSPFAFVRLPDSFCTGSSIMPQKRNPDAAELIRAKTGAINGSLISLLTVMKGLPLAYSKDMQEDKVPVFAAAEALELCLGAMTGMIEGITPNCEKMKKDAGEGFSNATDLADWLVRRLGIAFRSAHHITGRLVKLAEDKNCKLEDLSLEEMQQEEPQINAEVFSVLGVDNSVLSRKSFGGTSPEQVKEAIISAKKRFDLN